MRPQGILTRNAECNREEAVRWPTWTLEIRTNSINVSVTPEMKLQRNLEQNFKQTPNEHPNETLNEILQKQKKNRKWDLKKLRIFFWQNHIQFTEIFFVNSDGARVGGKNKRNNRVKMSKFAMKCVTPNGFGNMEHLAQQLTDRWRLEDDKIDATHHHSRTWIRPRREQK